MKELFNTYLDFLEEVFEPSFGRFNLGDVIFAIFIHFAAFFVLCLFCAMIIATRGLFLIIPLAIFGFIWWMYRLAKNRHKNHE